MPRKEDRPANITTDSRDLALRLLQLQQRFDALDHLYNEEIESLKAELKRLKGDFVRQHTSAPASERAKRTRRGATPRQPTQHAQQVEPEKEEK